MKTRNVFLGLLLSGLVSGGLVYADNATINTPKSESGAEIHPLYGGWKTKRIVNGDETVVCSGPCVIGGLLMSTGAVANLVELRDTTTADTSGARLMPLRYFTLEDTGAYADRLPNGRTLRTTKGCTAKITERTKMEEIYVLYMDY